MRCRIGSHVLRRALGDDLAATVAAFGAEVDDPVGGFDDVEVVFDDDDGVALVAQAMQHGKELFDVFEVQAGGGFVENVEGLAGVAFGQFASEFHALGLAAGEGGGGLAEADVGQADFDQHLQFARNGGDGVKEFAGVFDGHVQHFADVLAFVFHFQGFAVVAFAVADVAGDVDIGQEVHFHLDHTVALAGFAAAALDVEAEAAGLVAACSGFLGAGKQVAHGGEDAGVGGGV